MSAREGTRRRRISVLHMLGTWEGKIEGCNCPSCKECNVKGKTEATTSPVKSPTKSPKGSKTVVKKVSPKAKVTDCETSPQENSAQNAILNKVSSDHEMDDSDSVLNSVKSEKFDSQYSDKVSDNIQLYSEDSSVDGEQKNVEEESKVQGVMGPKKSLNLEQNLSLRNEASVKYALKPKAGGTKKPILEKVLKGSQKSDTEDEDTVDERTNTKQKGETDEMLMDSVMIKQEPEEYLSDLDDSDKPARGRYSEKGRGSGKRARIVTSEMENIYAKPRMIFTGRGVVRKFEPGVDRTPKSKRGRKPGKALLPINVKQESKDAEIVKQEIEIENHDLEELQRALSEAAENISDVGVELLDAFNELGEGTKKKQKKKPTPFFKRIVGDGDKYVECTICFKVLKESSMKQHYRTHTGEKPHVCDICQSRFTRKGDVERHKRLVHKSQKPFKCQKCMKEFADRKNLKAHLQNHDKAVYYGCSTCGFKFGKREYYENHIRYIHPVPDGALPNLSAPDDDLATKQLKQLEMEELKERNTQKRILNPCMELELDELEEEDDDDDDDMDEEDKAIEITVTDMDEEKLFASDGLMVKEEVKEDSMDGTSTNTQEEDEDEEEEEEEEEEVGNVVSTVPPVVQRSKVPSNSSSLLQLLKDNPQQAAKGGTNVKVSKGMLSMTQTIPDNDSQGDEDLVDKVIAAAVSQATDTIESLQAKSGANMSGNDIEFADEEETEEEERLDGTDDLQEILGSPSYEMLPIASLAKAIQQPAEIHITASVSGQQRKFIIQVPPGTNLNVQTPEGMEMIVNIVNQLCAGKGELDGPIEVVMNNPSNRLMLVNNKR